MNFRQAQLPQGWKIKRLKDIAEYSIGLTYSPKDVSNEGIIVLRSSNIQEGKIDLSDLVRVNKKIKENLIVKDGDILMCSRNGSKRLVGKIATIQGLPEVTTFGTFMTIIRSPYNQFLSWFFNSDYFREQIGGGENPMINQVTKYMLDEVEIPFPPIPEQKSIVAILEETFAAIAKVQVNAEENLKNAAALFESYLQGVFEDNVNVEGWEEKTLGEIGKVSMCKRVFKEETTSEGDIPFYKIGTFGKAPDAFITKERYNEFRSKFSFPKKGDILISASGTIGRRVKYDGEPAYFQDSNIVWINNDEKQILNDYLYYFYGACNWNATKGATISRLYNDNLKQIEIQFPKSISKQQTIVKKLDALCAETKKLESLYQKKIIDLDELKKSILQKAFSGEMNTSKGVVQ